LISFLLNLLGLLLPGFWLGRILRVPLSLRIGLMFLIFETSLVVGAGLLSWAGQLGQLRLYQVVTTLCAIAIALALRSIAQRDHSHMEFAPAKNTTTIETPTDRLSLAIPLVCLATFAAVMVFLVLNAYPSVEDSLTIKLPKVVFAIESNSILPTNLTDDQRMYISPVYPAMIQLFLIINGQTTHTLLMFGFVNWMVCGIAIHQLCRDVGSSNLASWAATALVLLSPVLIAQGTSEGDDIIAATPLVISLMFFVSWLRDNRNILAVLSGIGIGLSVAIKLLPILYLAGAPVPIALAIIGHRTFLKKWLFERAGGATSLIAAFILVQVPNCIANFVAFGNPLYVSNAIATTRNWPFSLDCALRNSVGYLKQFVFSDLVRSAARIFSIPAPSATRYESYKSAIDGFNNFFSRALPYDPTLACSAYQQPFSVTTHYITDNTLWFGIFGPILLLSSLTLVFSPTRSTLIRNLAWFFLVWIFAFSFSQKYLAEIGRYWSMTVLAATPVAAVAIDIALRRFSQLWARSLLMSVAAIPTILLGAFVLIGNVHRSVPQALTTSRYRDGFEAEFRSMMEKAPAVNIRTAYGIDTYDYYMLLGSSGKLFNKSDLLAEAMNIVVVRPSGLIDNPYLDPRIPVKMRRALSGAFRYVGKVRPQPGFEYNLGFANHTELIALGPANVDPRSEFLLFEVQGVGRDGNSIVGSIAPIEDSTIIRKLRCRVGWREPSGDLVTNSEWHHGSSLSFKIPDQATALILQVAIDDSDNDGQSEWPIRDFDPKIAQRLYSD